MLTTETLKRRARDRLLKELASGGLPPGSRVSESRLARDLGSSRGPVREAVSELASQGLLEQIPGFGAFVKLPTPREMEDLYEFREALECHAAFLAADRITPAQVAGLRGTLDETRRILVAVYDADRHDLDEATASRWLRIDARFHGLILAAAGSAWLQRHGTDVHFLRRIWCQRLNPELFAIRHVLANSYRDHTRIVRALARGDAEESRRLMLTHIQTTKRRFVAQVARQSEGLGPWPASAAVSEMSASSPRRSPRRRKPQQSGATP
jgi:DNA-binding GntR family transcriptional regulator